MTRGASVELGYGGCDGARGARRRRRALCAGEGETRKRKGECEEGKKSTPSLLFNGKGRSCALDLLRTISVTDGGTAPRSAARSATGRQPPGVAQQIVQDSRRREGDAVKALKCPRGHNYWCDPRDTCGTRAMVTSIRAREPKRLAEMLCHVH